MNGVQADTIEDEEIDHVFLKKEGLQNPRGWIWTAVDLRTGRML